MHVTIALTGLAIAATGLAQSVPTIQTGGLVQNGERYETRLRVDNGTYGPEIEEVHYCKATVAYTSDWSIADVLLRLRPVAHWHRCSFRRPYLCILHAR